MLPHCRVLSGLKAFSLRHQIFLIAKFDGREKKRVAKETSSTNSRKFSVVECRSSKIMNVE